MKINVGDKLKFKSEKIRYTVTACDERFVIATKPFNPKKTFLYTIIDLVEKKRSSDDCYCRFNYEDPEDAKKALPQLHAGLDRLTVLNNNAMSLSRRRIIDLDLVRVDKKKPEKEGLVFRYYNTSYFNKKKMVLEEKRGMRLLKRESNLNDRDIDFYMEMLTDAYDGSGCMETGFGQMIHDHMYRFTITDWDCGDIAWYLIGHHYEWPDKSKHKLIEYKRPKFD